MREIWMIILALCIFFITGCSDISKYNDDDIAAVVRGEEITIGDLRFLYPDNKVLDLLDGEVKATLVYQEAKKMDIHVDGDITGIIENYPSESAQSTWAQSTREYAEKQAKKLGMEPEEYYKKYVAMTAEKSLYIDAYVHEKLGISSDQDEIDEEKFNEQANQLINELVAKYEDEIDIRIK